MKVCELGPGNSAGTGIAALLSGAESYTGLDAFPYPFAVNQKLTNELVRKLSELYATKSPIPGPDQFPRIRPELEQYDFPSWLFAGKGADLYLSRCKALAGGAECDLISRRLVYIAPYEGIDLSEWSGAFDALFSQAVLEHVKDVAETYRMIFRLLKPLGWSWHVIDFRSHGLSSEWNGHWRYPEWLWKIVLGQREFLLNRMPLEKHIESATQAGFTIVAAFPYREGEHPALGSKSGMGPESFAPPFNLMSKAGASTMGAMVILQKP